MTGTLRDSLVLGALTLAVFGLERRGWSQAGEAPSGQSPSGNVILVVSDGLRWQEVFRGADSTLLFGESKALGGDAAQVRRRYWRPSLSERRSALMPFVWGTLAGEGGGQLLGNRDIGGIVKVTNRLNFSYPGYSEMLVGYPDPRINRNDYGPNPNVTVFEWLKRRGGLGERVAAAGAWSTFADIFNVRRSGIYMHASRRDPVDARTHAAALSILKQRTPRALFVAYVETDDHSHAGRYDLTLDAAHAVDRYLSELWAAVQSNPAYRGQTTLLFTADHGRGRTQRDWTDHGRDVSGAEEIFLASIGPGIPARGEARGVASQAQIAATVAAVLGVDYRRDAPAAAAPIAALVSSPARAGRAPGN